MISHKVSSRFDIIPLGRQGENGVRQIMFRASSLQGELEDGNFILLHQRRGDTQPYPVAITEEDGYIIWTVSNTDTANAGLGRCELQYIADDIVKKSRIWETKVFEALEEAGEMPDPESGWVAQMMAEIEEKLSAQGVDTTEVNELIAKYLEDNSALTLPDASKTRDGTILVTQNGQWILLHMGLEDITEEEF